MTRGRDTIVRNTEIKERMIASTERLKRNTGNEKVSFFRQLIRGIKSQQNRKKDYLDKDKGDERRKKVQIN